MKCEDCSHHVRDDRPKLCWHCGLRVCWWCWENEHKCEPGHLECECYDLPRLRRYGLGWINRLRGRLNITKGYNLSPLTPAEYTPPPQVNPNNVHTVLNLLVVLTIGLSSTLGGIGDRGYWGYNKMGQSNSRDHLAY